MGYFLAALKNWESGGLEQAVPLFRKVVNEPSLADDSVLDWYQDATENYLADYRALTSEPMNSEPGSVRECRKAIEELNRKLTLLKTKGRARFNIRARQLDFARLEKSLKNRPRKTPAKQPDVMEEIAVLAKSYDFVKLVKKVSALDSDPPGYKRESLLGVAQAALVFLTEIESDLGKRPAVVDLTLKDGTEVSSIGIASGNELVGKLADGEIRDLSWTDFPTDQLIELHRELVKSPGTELERLRRHESAIAFEWLSGDRERAVVAAGRLSEESPGFKSRWDTLASGLPK